jgi:NAD(P)-dependent dehydrogenase (short-subunit alcohol dehydrogenase family)
MLTFVTYLQGTIVACCRTPDTATDLTQFIATKGGSLSSRVQLYQLDVEDQRSIEAFGSHMRQSFSRVDLLLNVAGILGDGQLTPGPERSLSKMDRAWFEKTLAVNLIGPVMLSKELYPLLIQRRTQSTASGTDLRPKAVVVNLSARVGSIADNGLGGWYSYRMSKSALNQYTRTLALELKRQSAWAIAVHPGTTDTGLSQPFQANVKDGSLFPVDFTVTKLLNVIDSLQDEHSGGFYDWSGQSLSF